MERWMPRREDVLDELAGEVLGHYGAGRAAVAVDGRDGAGQSEFADLLAEAVQRAGGCAVRAAVPQASGAPPRPVDAAAYLAAGYDDEAFRSQVLVPFREGSEPCLLIVDGVFLQRRDIARVFSYTIWLHTPAETAAARLAGQGWSDAEIEAAAGAQRLYRAHLRPWATATANIDNSDPEHPRRTFADSC